MFLLKKYLLVISLFFSSPNSFANSLYSGDWDLNPVGLRVLPVEDRNSELAVLWCKREPFIKESRCTSKDSFVFILNADGSYSHASSDQKSKYRIHVDKNSPNILNYSAWTNWGGDIELTASRINRN